MIILLFLIVLANSQLNSKIINSDCYLKKTKEWKPHSFIISCKDIVNNPRKDIIDKKCICNNGKWNHIW